MKLVIGIIFILVVGGAFVPLFSYIRETKNENNKASKMKKGNQANGNYNIDVDKHVEIESSEELLEFDNIEICNEDQAMVKVTDNEYIAYLEVGGVSFNLLSEEEKLQLENNFGNLLNGIDFDFQIFVQARTLALDRYVNRYKEKVEKIADKLRVLEDKLDRVTDEDEKEKITKEYLKVSNQLEYGENLLNDFINNNIYSNLLERKFFIVLKYFHNPEEYNDLSEREVLECAYNDLINKANSFQDILIRNNMSCKFLNGLEIAELMHNSFNKDDSEAFQISKAIKARYNHLVTTAKPIEIKEMELEKKRVKEEQEQLRKDIKELAKEKGSVERCS